MAVGGNSKNGRKGSYVISINIFWRNVEEAAILAFSERKANTLQSIHFVSTYIGLRASCSRFAIIS